MTTIRTVSIRALAATAFLAVPAPALAHPGEGRVGILHDLLHGFLLGPEHGLRPVGLLLVLVGAGGVLAASRAARSERRGALRAAGSAAVLAGLALTLA